MANFLLHLCGVFGLAALPLTKFHIFSTNSSVTFDSEKDHRYSPLVLFRWFFFKRTGPEWLLERHISYAGLFSQ